MLDCYREGLLAHPQSERLQSDGKSHRDIAAERLGHVEVQEAHGLRDPMSFPIDPVPSRTQFGCPTHKWQSNPENPRHPIHK